MLMCFMIQVLNITFADISSDTCMSITWGDGNQSLYANDSDCETSTGLTIQGEISTQMSLTHTYAVIGLYTIGIKAENALNTLEESARLVLCVTI